MSATSELMQGCRLEFVVRKLKGTVTRTIHTPPPTKKQIEEDPDLAGKSANEPVATIMEAGYMVFMPSGQSYRLSEKQLIARGFDRPPNILNREAARDNSTPAGRFFLAMREADRNKAYKEMEDEVIKKCTGRIGSDLTGIVADYDPKGQVPEKEAA